jgi:hypothetical protein
LTPNPNFYVNKMLSKSENGDTIIILDDIRGIELTDVQKAEMRKLFADIRVKNFHKFYIGRFDYKIVPTSGEKQ